jgi:uncharacterized protein YbjT (DUF2867 family)
MKIVVIGGSGRVGGNVVGRLGTLGHDAVPASPATGVDTITGEGLADVMAGADVVVDVSNSPVWDDDAVREFFTTSTRNQIAAERDAGVKHHVAVSIVGADRLPDSGYLRAKVAQEAEVEAGGVPYTILRATQFFEFLPQIVDAGAEGEDTVRLSTGLMQLVAADDVAATVTELATGAHGRRRPARALLRHRAARRRADDGRRRAHRLDRLRDVDGHAPPGSRAMTAIRTIVTGPEEAYNNEAELWCANELMAVTVLHEGRLHLRIDPRADGGPWLADVDSLAHALIEAEDRLAAY